MPEYIEREAFEEALKENHDDIMQDPTYGKQRQWWEALRYNRVRGILAEIPAADVAEVRHGEFESLEDEMFDTVYRCSVCKEDFVLLEGTPTDNLWKYCPNCGAKMDGKGDGE